MFHEVCVFKKFANLMGKHFVSELRFLINLQTGTTSNHSLTSSLPEVFCKKGVLRYLAKFTGKHLCQSLFFNKVAGFSFRLWHRYFPANFAKFLRTFFLTEHLRWLLLKDLEKLYHLGTFTKNMKMMTKYFIKQSFENSVFNSKFTYSLFYYTNYLIKFWWTTQQIFTCSKSTIETLEKGVTYIQS